MVSQSLCVSYSPPEELVLPQSFPKAPLPAVSALLAPLAWQFGRPDLFDAYSAGVIFMQLAGEAPRDTCVQLHAAGRGPPGGLLVCSFM